MKDLVYLVFSKSGIVGSRKTMPRLSSGHFAVKLKLEVADKYFKQAIPEANLKLGDESIIAPEVQVDPVLTMEGKIEHLQRKFEVELIHIPSRDHYEIIKEGDALGWLTVPILMDEDIGALEARVEELVEANR